MSRKPIKSTCEAIALTAYARDEDRERALAAGFDRHLAKPVEAEALLEAIVKLVIGNWLLGSGNAKILKNYGN